MKLMELKWRRERLRWLAIGFGFLLASAELVSADRRLRSEPDKDDREESGYLLKVVNFLWQPNESSYQHVWPVSNLLFSSF